MAKISASKLWLVMYFDGEQSAAYDNHLFSTKEEAENHRQRRVVPQITEDLSVSDSESLEMTQVVTLRGLYKQLWD